MNKSTVVGLARKVALVGHGYQNPVAVGLVGLWRSSFLLFGLALLGRISLPALSSLGIQPDMQFGGPFNLLRYPLIGVATVAFGVLAVLIPMLLKTLFIELGRRGEKEV